MKATSLLLARLSICLIAVLTLSATCFTTAWGFKSQQQTDLFKRVQTSSKGYIDVDSKEFAAIIELPRDFAVTALLTTTDGKIKCGPCLSFQPQFDNLAAQWNKNKAVKNKHIFIKAELSRAQQIFAQFQLQHAPVMYTFPAPTNAIAAPEHVAYDFALHGFGAADVSHHLNKLLGTNFSYRKPLNVKLISAVATSVVAAFGALYIFSFYLPMLVKSSKPFWMLVCLSTMIIFTSGQMWNSIRNAPYIAMGAAGRPEYFAAGFQNQYGVETQIVAVLYMLLAFSFIALTVLVPAQRDPTRQRAGVYVWSAIFLATFSLLFMIFRMKNPSYPFRLFF